MQHDVIVIGDGVVAAALVAGLTRQGLDLAQVCAKRPMRKSLELWRPEAIRRAVSLGIGIPVSDSSTSFQRLSAWETTDAVELDAGMDPYGEAHFVDRRQLCTRASVNPYAGYSGPLRRIDCAGNIWRIVLGDAGSSQLQAPFVLDCSGSSRAFARGVGYRILRTGALTATGVVLTHSQEVDHSSTLLVEASHDCWWNLMRHAGVTVVYMFTEAHLPLYVSTPASLIKLIETRTHHIRRYMPKSDDYSLSPLCILPAYSSLVLPLDQKNWIAVGDSVLSSDPLSGSGVLNGLRQVEFILNSFHNGSMSGAAVSAYKAYMIKEFEEHSRVRGKIYRRSQFSSLPFWSSTLREHGSIHKAPDVPR